ncbi:MAG: PEP-CTERM sorting domain-containing protein, partial [Pirellulaceae bacterium]
TAISGTAAEADIHYFPNVNKLVSAPSSVSPDTESIQLAESAQILFRHSFVESTGNAFATATNGTFNSIARSFTPDIASGSSTFVANLPYGQYISGLSSFFSKGNTGTMARGYGSGPFNSPGDGFLAFQFNVGNGTQYGWARVTTLDSNGNAFNDFMIEDYAYADPNQSLRVGEIPEPGSLGLLATGAAGLLTWRRKRKPAHSAA